MQFRVRAITIERNIKSFAFCVLRIRLRTEWHPMSPKWVALANGTFSSESIFAYSDSERAIRMGKMKCGNVLERR